MDDNTPDPNTPPGTGTTPPPPPAISAARQPANVQPDSGNVAAPIPANATPPQAAPVVMTQQRRHGLAGVLDEVRNWIAGTQGYGVYMDQDGNRYVQHPQLSANQQWRRVGLEALVGASQGLAAGQGPGGHGRAAAAGVGAGMGLIKQERDEADQQAELDYQRQRQAKIDKANDQIRQLQIAEGSLRLDRMKVDATQDMITFAQGQDDRYEKEGGVDLGVYNSGDIHEIEKARPDIWKDHFADNSIRAVPQYDANGKPAGVRFWYVPPGRENELMPQGTKVPQYTQNKDASKMGDTSYFTPTDPMSRRQYNAYLDTYHKAMQDDQSRLTGAAQLTEAQAKAGVAGEMANLSVKEAKAKINEANASAREHIAKAQQMDLENAMDGRGDATGFTPKIGEMGGLKEYNKRLDSYKKNLDEVNKTEASYHQFQDTLNNLAAGKPMTGAESVTGLFNAIGLSAAPLKGGGFRMGKNVIAEHEHARGWLGDLQQLFLKAKDGDVITPQQLRDYARIAQNSRYSTYVNLVNQMHNSGVNADAALPTGNGQKIDASTAKIFFDLAGGDANKARSIATAKGWQVQ